jgi:hypothetical protein
MRLTTKNECGYLRATGSGTFVLPKAELQFLELIDSVSDHRADRVLFDGRAISGNVDALERYFYGDFAAYATERMAKEEVLKPPKFAYVLQHPTLDSKRLGEKVARSRGLIVRAFDNEIHALAWLMSDER